MLLAPTAALIVKVCYFFGGKLRQKEKKEKEKKGKEKERERKERGEREEKREERKIVKKERN